MREFLERVLEKPIEIIGYTRQRIPGSYGQKLVTG